MIPNLFTWCNPLVYWKKKKKKVFDCSSQLPELSSSTSSLCRSGNPVGLLWNSHDAGACATRLVCLIKRKGFAPGGTPIFEGILPLFSSLLTQSLLRDRSQTLVRGGGADAKMRYERCDIFGPLSLLQTSKNFRAPFSPWKLRVNPGPKEKHVNSFFTGKFVVIFSRPPLQGSKILRGSFARQVP